MIKFLYFDEYIFLYKQNFLDLLVLCRAWKEKKISYGCV